ncbi:MAG: 2-amino-4-hydroxy-6-hydroxymethyldihydropteridine diphosphokinase [Lentisphaeria bacterium]|nr:2-amino-4-hydroxy-6-hydroxymethyldihydropteridine diphosphokinase [Lentisphaeria bacterium]
MTAASLRTLLSLGGNLGDVPATFRQAETLLTGGGFAVEKVSSVFHTAPVDCPPDTPDFCNIAIAGYWSGTPEELLTLTQSIEVRLGRPADHGYHLSRTLDIDIVWMEKTVIQTPRLTIPHPEAKKRRFVLDPVQEIAPEVCRELVSGKGFQVCAMEVLNFFYPEDTPLRRLLLTHSRQVTAKALTILANHPELDLSVEQVSCAGMLHDLGVGRCHAPSIFCTGEADYLQHGLIGGEMLREYAAARNLDLEQYARVCERHTGSGITRQEIAEQKLPLPERDLLPETVLEKLICYADKFYSKSGDLQEKNLPKVRRSMAKFGEASLARFDAMTRLFG